MRCIKIFIFSMCLSVASIGFTGQSAHAGHIDFGSFSADLATSWSVLDGNPDSSIFNHITFAGSPGTSTTVYGMGTEPNGLPYNAVPLGQAFMMLSFFQSYVPSDFGDFTLGLNFLFTYDDGYQDDFTLELLHLAGQANITFGQDSFSRRYHVRDSNMYLQMVGFTDTEFTDWNYPGLYEHPWANTSGLGVCGDLWAKPVVVPEPSSVLLCLSTLLVMGMQRKSMVPLRWGK